MEIVTSARAVCRSRPQVVALSHVCDLIASCLAPPKSWTIETAIYRGCAHLSRHLLDELAENPELHFLTKRARARQYLSVAASVGDIALMEHLVERFGCCVDSLAVTETVEGGHLEALQWLFDLSMASVAPGDDVKAFKKRVLPDYYMSLASSIGHLEMLQWMHNIVGCVSADQVLQEAARYGHMHVIEWVLPMVEIPLSEMNSFHLIEAAMDGGHIDITEFLISKCRLRLGSGAIAATICSCGQMELVSSLYDNGAEGCTSASIDYATINGNLDVVQWLHSKGFGCSTNAMDSAAENGHLAVVQFLHENRLEGCTSAAFKAAVDNDHLDVAQYLFEHRRGDCTSAWMDEVAGESGLEMLKWLQSNCPNAECTVNAMDSAAANGHLDVVEFLHENRREGCTTSAMDKAAQNGHLEVVKFLHENRTEGCSAYAMNQAAKNGHLDMVEWLHFNRTEGCTTEAMNAAAKYGHLEIVTFLHTNRAEGCTTWAMDAAHDLKVLRWLDENRREGFTSRALLNAAAQSDLEMLLWLHDRATADMWTPMLAKGFVWHSQIEMLEWLADSFPAFVDARTLLSSCDEVAWWVWTWLKQRVDR